MGWFKRIKDGIITPTKEKKETPEGLWYKCPKCNHVTPTDEHTANLAVCLECGFHARISSADYFSMLFDDGNYEELNANMTSGDPLEFQDTKKYVDRVAASQKKTGLADAIRTGVGTLDGKPLCCIRGANSDLLSVDTLAEMVRRRPDMIVAEVPDRAHIPFLDEPEAVLALRTWLGELA